MLCKGISILISTNVRQTERMMHERIYHHCDGFIDHIALYTMYETKWCAAEWNNFKHFSIVELHYSLLTGYQSFQFIFVSLIRRPPPCCQIQTSVVVSSIYNNKWSDEQRTSGNKFFFRELNRAWRNFWTKSSSDEYCALMKWNSLEFTDRRIILKIEISAHLIN